MKLKNRIQSISFINEPYTKWKWRERKVAYGKENADKVFYVVRRATCKAGLFSYVMTNMGGVKYAIEHDYIPVIDMQFNQNTYLEESKVGKTNAWEYYFEQPLGYGLSDIRRSKNVILGCGLIGEDTLFPGAETAWDPALYQNWRNIFSRYFIIKEEIRREAEKLFREMFGGARTLGVLARGTDYVNNRPKHHPIQPEADRMICDVRKAMETYRCQWIYLATEDESIYAQFRQAFGSRVKVTGAKRYSDTRDRNINDISCAGPADRYLRGKEYLLNILLLSLCNCLIAGNTNGTLGALFMSESFEYQYVYNLGFYE